MSADYVEHYVKSAPIARTEGIHEPNLHQSTFKKDSRVWLHKNRRSSETRGQPQRRDKAFASIPEQEDLTHDFVFSIIDSKGHRYKKDSRSWLHKNSDRRRPRLEREERAASDPVDISKASKQQVVDDTGTQRKFVHSDSMMTRINLPPASSKTRSSRDAIHGPQKPLAASKSLDSTLAPPGSMQKANAKTFHLVSSTARTDARAQSSWLRAPALGQSLAPPHSSVPLALPLDPGAAQAPALSRGSGSSEPACLETCLQPSTSRASTTTQHNLQLASSDESSGPIQPPTTPEVGLRRSAALMPRQRGGYNSQDPGSHGSSSSDCDLPSSLGSLPSPTDLGSLPSPSDLGPDCLAGDQGSLNTCSRSMERFLVGPASTSTVDVTLVEHLL